MVNLHIQLIPNWRVGCNNYSWPCSSGNGMTERILLFLCFYQQEGLQEMFLVSLECHSFLCCQILSRCIFILVIGFFISFLITQLCCTIIFFFRFHILAVCGNLDIVSCARSYTSHYSGQSCQVFIPSLLNSAGPMKLLQSGLSHVQMILMHATIMLQSYYVTMLLSYVGELFCSSNGN